MVTVTADRKIQSSVSEAWKILTDESKESEYWSELRNIKVKSRTGNVIERDGTVGPKVFALKTHQLVTLNPESSIGLTFTGDRVDGERAIRLDPVGDGFTMVSVKWDLHLKDVPGFVDGIVQNQITKITEKALDRIAKEAEKK